MSRNPKWKIHVANSLTYHEENDEYYYTLCGIDGAEVEGAIEGEAVASAYMLLDVPIVQAEEYMCEECASHTDYPLLMLGATNG